MFRVILNRITDQTLPHVLRAIHGLPVDPPVIELEKEASVSASNGATKQGHGGKRDNAGRRPAIKWENLELPPSGTRLTSSELDVYGKKLGIASAGYAAIVLRAKKRIKRIAFRKGEPGGSIFEVLPQSKSDKKEITSLVLAPVGTVMRQHEIGRLLPGIGWSLRSVDWACKSLIEAGRLKKVNVGQYEVLKTRAEG